MSKVITFSRQFPSYHPKAGQPTHFVEKIYNEIGIKIGITKDSGDIPMGIHSLVNDFFLLDGQSKKKHTIRKGSRFKVGEKFSPRIWSGLPYKSKQIIIAPDIEVKKVYNIELVVRGDFKEFVLWNQTKSPISLNEVAQNDGLNLTDFLSWFPKPFQGQIICWSDDVYY